MMVPKIFLISLSVILLTSCSTPEPEIITRTEFVEKDVPIQNRPRGVSLNDVEWRVVTSENLDAFLEEISVGDGYVFYAISVSDYENLSLNLAELRRYILQQRELIVYYENAVR